MKLFLMAAMYVAVVVVVVVFVGETLSTQSSTSSPWRHGVYRGSQLELRRLRSKEGGPLSQSLTMTSYLEEHEIPTLTLGIDSDG